MKLFKTILFLLLFSSSANANSYAEIDLNTDGTIDVGEVDINSGEGLEAYLECFSELELSIELGTDDDFYCHVEDRLY